ncbi:MAG TPA: methionine--tRNA ligase [Coriobacteriia bacterium]|nr:methionine--tRNA ligase [Coriobacteriia bacterium]
MSGSSFYITTPIYYVNSVPHLGTAYTTIAADSLARYRRMVGDDVFFLTGLDEHGQKVEQAATENGMTPQDWVDSIAPKFQSSWAMLDITNDDFIRTTQPRHRRAVQVLAQELYDRGDIYKGKYEGWYCVPDETYWAESDLEEAKTCPQCGRPLEFVQEDSYFFKLSAYQDKLLALYDSNPDFIRPESRRNEVLSFVKGGLRDLSVSRANVKWGVPLPWDADHTMYVWFDALINYMTAVGYGDAEKADEFARRWPANIHFVGKDIIRFHCVIWPAMLMAAELPVPKGVFAHGFLLTKGEKMSKSKGNAMAPADLVARFGVDGYRYYFMRDVQFGTDGSISLEAMVQRYNGDLANDWGNLCSRLFNMVGKYFDGAVPDPSAAPEITADDQVLRDLAAELPSRYEAAMAKLDYAGGLEAAWDLIKAANRYIEDSAPWNLAKTEETKPRLAAVIYNALETVRIAAIFTAPVMPNTSAEVWRRLSLADVGALTDAAAAAVWGQLAVGNAVEKGDPLFPRIVEDDSEG